MSLALPPGLETFFSESELDPAWFAATALAAVRLGNDRPQNGWLVDPRRVAWTAVRSLVEQGKVLPPEAAAAALLHQAPWTLDSRRAAPERRTQLRRIFARECPRAEAAFTDLTWSGTLAVSDWTARHWGRAGIAQPPRGHYTPIALQLWPAHQDERLLHLRPGTGFAYLMTKVVPAAATAGGDHELARALLRNHDAMLAEATAWFRVPERPQRRALLARAGVSASEAALGSWRDVSDDDLRALAAMRQA